MVADTRTVGVTLGINLAITLGAFSLFSLLRVARWSRRWYAPSRFRTAADAAALAVAAGAPGHPPPGAPSPPALPLTLLTWVAPLLALREEEVLRVTGGLDVAMYLRVVRFGLALSALVAVWVVGVVLPVNFTGGNLNVILGTAATDEEPPAILLGPIQSAEALANEIANNTYVFSSLDKLSMANVPPADPRLWVHLASTYVISAVAMRLLWHYSTEAVELRYRYLANASPGGASRTVLVTDIPGVPAGTLLNRALVFVDGAFGWVLPPHVKRRVRASWQAAFGRIAQRRKAAAGRVTPSLPPGDDSDDSSRDGDSGSEGGRSESLPPLEAVPAAGALAAAAQHGAAAGGGGSSGSAAAEQQPDKPPEVLIVASPPDQSGAPAGVTKRLKLLRPKGAASAFAGAVSQAAAAAAAAGGTAAADLADAAARPARRRARTPDVGAGGGSASSSNGGRGNGSCRADAVDVGVRRRARAALDAMARLRLGRPRLHDEWRRAHERLAGGMTVEDLVREEFQEVYSDAAVAAVAPAHHTRALDAALANYEAARAAAEDLLDHLERRLDRAAARAAAAADGTQRAVAAAAELGGGGGSGLGSAAAAASASARQLQAAAKAARARARRLAVKPPAKRLDNTTLATGWARATYGPGVRVVGLLRFRLDWLREAHRRLQLARATALSRSLPSAFVTFAARWPAVVAGTSLHTHDESCWRLRPAPNPDEVIWRALRMRLWERSLRRVLVVAALVVLALFYVVPVAALQGLLQLDRLRRVPVLDRLLDLPVVHSLLLGLLPGLALRLFVLLLPVLLYPLMRAGGAVSKGDVDFQVSTAYFVFQVIAVFGATFISGTLFAQIQVLLENPKQALVILGTGVPQTAGFFILYILFIALIGRSLGLLRPGGLLLFAARTAFAGTARARARSWQLQVTAFGPRIPDMTIVLLLTLVFSCIQPLVVVAGLIFFATSLLVEKYNLVYVFRREFESGGRMWRQVFVQIVTALYLYQAVMLSLLSIKRFVFAPLLVPLLALTVLYHRAAMALFRRPWETLSLRDARDLDDADAAACGGGASGVSTPLLSGALSGAPSGGNVGTGRSSGGGGGGGGGASASAAAAQAAAQAAAAAGDGALQYLPPAFWPREAEVSQLAADAAAYEARLAAHNSGLEEAAAAAAAAATAAVQEEQAPAAV